MGFPRPGRHSDLWRLNIEVDGERYHRSWTGELCLRDQLRNQRPIELGWEVKRFWVYEVRDRLPQCVATVAQWVEEAYRIQSERSVDHFDVSPEMAAGEGVLSESASAAPR